MNPTKLSSLMLSLSLLAAGGCGLIYKQNIQQGNALEQEDLEAIERFCEERDPLYHDL